jgi:hypothetical protein
MEGMLDEMHKLSAEQKAAVLEAAGMARKKPGRHAVKAADGEAYAYSIAGGEIAWGFRAGSAILARGVVPL